MKHVNRQLFLITCLGFVSFTLHIQNSYSKEPISIELPLLINGAYIGDISALIDPSNSDLANTILDKNRLLELFKDHSSEKQQEQWFNNIEGSNKISINYLQDQGLIIEYDSGQLQIVAKIIKDGLSFLSLSRRQNPNPADFHPLAKYAAGLNIELEPSYTHSGENKGLDPLQADFSGFITSGQFNASSLLFESNYLEDDEHEFSRGDITLIRNDFKRAVRYALGDVRPTVSRFQSAIDIAGLSIERDYEQINPFKNLRPNGRNTFTLERDSTVTFEVNGVVVLIQELVAGSYSVSDFPLITGNNDVTIIINDGQVSEEISRFSTFVDTSLLAKGFTNFGLNIGFPVDPDSDNRAPEYLNDAVALAFWEKGISDHATLGIQLEFADYHKLIAGSYVLGNRFGSWAVEAAASNQDDIGSGFSGLIQYELEPTFKIVDWSTQLDLQYRYKSDDFINLGQSQTSEKEHFLSSRFRLQKQRVSLSFSGNFRKVAERDTKTISMNISRSFPSFSSSLGLQYSDDSDSGTDERFNISFSKKIGKTHRIRARYNSNNDNFSTEFRNSNGNNAGNLFYQASYDNDEDNQGADVGIRYLQPRFELDASHRVNKRNDNNSNNSSDSSTDFTLATALGVADGHFSFGRPFNNGFIILNRHDNLNNKKITVRKSSFNNDNFTSTQLLDSLLIPIDSSYRKSQFIIDVDDLPIGYDIDGGEIKILPNQTPAYVYQVGSDAPNIVVGKLYYSTDKPLSLIAGKLISKDNLKSQPINFFTNRTGRFVAEKVAPGNYQIQLTASEKIVGEIDIKQAKEPGLIDVGKIVLENYHDN